jgi:hypothetical protein
LKDVLLPTFASNARKSQLGRGSYSGCLADHYAYSPDYRLKHPSKGALELTAYLRGKSVHIS